mmetsp:Transcript_39425/g.39960  ORF Transcript_39425/g.39960 Transcript_39425/m.39960 type:complete len:81 (-) Transcript_39425:177-419(-)
MAIVRNSRVHPRDTGIDPYQYVIIPRTGVTHTLSCGGVGVGGVAAEGDGIVLLASEGGLGGGIDGEDHVLNGGSFRCETF